MEITKTDPTNVAPEFIPFPSISRIRNMTISEKIDGTNAQVYITDDFRLFAGSRSRWITPENDNAGFARWVKANYDELMTLGPGSHFGEWWGSGIQRGYGLPKGEKRFSLFNATRWTDDVRPKCCHVVPVLYEGPFDTAKIDGVLADLQITGSMASPGFMNIEGIVVWHEKSRTLFKKTVDGDGHKGQK
jgi:hypothetical protein